MFATTKVKCCNITLLLLLQLISSSISFAPAKDNRIALTKCAHSLTDKNGSNSNESTSNKSRHINIITRSHLIHQSQLLLSSLLLTSYILPQPVFAKCTDIESCREEGERKIEADLKSNPIIKLSDGVRYRVLSPPLPNKSERVKEGSSIDLAYSISTASGQYMYSKGFGYEKVEFGGRLQSDAGLDSIRITIGQHDIPIGIEYALLGMGRGERRRVELPPGVGFETSQWKPEPTTRRGKAQIEGYKRKLVGFGSQPPFPAETVWDVEVLGIRN